MLGECSSGDDNHSEWSPGRVQTLEISEAFTNPLPHPCPTPPTPPHPPLPHLKHSQNMTTTISYPAVDKPINLLRYVTLRYVTLRYVTFTLCYVTLCYVIRYVAFLSNFLYAMAVGGAEVNTHCNTTVIPL
jgi:hypothetical protein